MPATWPVKVVSVSVTLIDEVLNHYKTYRNNVKLGVRLSIPR